MNKVIKVPTSQNEFDALVSETYNIGITAMQDSTFIKRHNAGDKVGCAEAMQWWNKVTVKGKKVTSNGLKTDVEWKLTFILTVYIQSNIFIGSFGSLFYF